VEQREHPDHEREADRTPLGEQVADLADLELDDLEQPRSRSFHAVDVRVRARAITGPATDE